MSQLRPLVDIEGLEDANHLHNMEVYRMSSDSTLWVQLS